ncbi:hypothetical protein ACGFR8_21005 [Streptomyces brevispora]|uniref:hypothetical protein n=1 Tax=Streptomyces brevispora TaxID=887462 RepID=UPI00371BCF76
MTERSRVPGPGGPDRRRVAGGLTGVGTAVLAAPAPTVKAFGPKTVTFGSEGADTTPEFVHQRPRRRRGQPPDRP